MIKRLERIKNTVNKYMADIRQDRLTICESERKSVVSRQPSVLVHINFSPGTHFPRDNLLMRRISNLVFSQFLSFLKIKVSLCDHHAVCVCLCLCIPQINTSVAEQSL
jgi:hypothetical protein